MACSVFEYKVENVKYWEDELCTGLNDVSQIRDITLHWQTVGTHYKARWMSAWEDNIIAAYFSTFIQKKGIKHTGNLAYKQSLQNVAKFTNFCVIQF